MCTEFLGERLSLGVPLLPEPELDPKSPPLLSFGESDETVTLPPDAVAHCTGEDDGMCCW